MLKRKSSPLFVLSFMLALGLCPAPARAAFQTVCASGCTFTTITLAYAGAASGDTLVLKQNFAENATFARTITITVSSDDTLRTWDGANNVTATLTLQAVNSTYLTGIVMDHSSASGGVVIADSSNGDPRFFVYNCTLKRTSTSTTNPWIIAGSALNNRTAPPFTLSRTALVGNATSSGVTATGTLCPMFTMANCTVGGFSGAGQFALQTLNGNNNCSASITNCSIYNNSTGYSNAYAGANTNLTSFFRNDLFMGNTTDVVFPTQTNPANALRSMFSFDLFTQMAPNNMMGMGNLFGGTPANEVVSPTLGSEDLHLKAGAWSINNGFATGATTDDIAGTPASGVRDISAYEFTVVNCVGGAATQYFNSQLMNRVTGTTKNLDLSVAGTLSNGLGSPLEVTTTSINYSVVSDIVFRPGTTAFTFNSGPGASSKTYGWVSPRVMNNDLAAGNWTFSNRFQGNIGAPAAVIRHEVAVYAWDPASGTDTLLFSAINGATDMAASISAFAKFTDSFTVAQPGFSGTAGKYLKVEVYANITGSGFGGGTVYLGFNTASDFVTYPGDNCGSPTITPTFSASPTISPTPTQTLSLTSSPTFSATPTTSPTLTVTPTFSTTGTPSSTASPTSSATPSSTASPSSTSTPQLPLVKSANVSAADFGDTVTYSLSYTNDSNNSVTMSIWDTVPGQIGFIGCDSGCTQSGGIVSWTLPGVAPGATGTVQFWGSINAYPFLPWGHPFMAWSPPWRLELLEPSVRRRRSEG